MEMIEILKALKELGLIQAMPAAPEAREVKPEKAYYTAEDIRERYGVGINDARAIMRAIKHVNGGSLALGAHKALPSEVKFWEDNRGHAPQEVPR